MDTKIMEQFHEMDITMLSSIEGGKNNWQTNVLEGGGAAFGGWGVGQLFVLRVVLERHLWEHVDT
ncbi:BlpM [Streptococcus pneumoniae]|nr:BlpM [Streptococcus pneumoniae]